MYSAQPGSKLTSVLFTANTDGLLVGDSTGMVSVYQLQNITMAEDTQVNSPRDDQVTSPRDDQVTSPRDDQVNSPRDDQVN